MRRAREDEEFYRTAVALRRLGWRVCRVDSRHSRLNGKCLANAELLRRAEMLLQQPVQLELFGWGNRMRAAAVEAVVVERSSSACRRCGCCFASPPSSGRSVDEEPRSLGACRPRPLKGTDNA